MKYFISNDGQKRRYITCKVALTEREISALESKYSSKINLILEGLCLDEVGLLMTLQDEIDQEKVGES